MDANLTIGVFEILPDTIIKKNHVTDTFVVKGLTADIIHVLSQTLRFSYKYIESEQEFGIKSNGSWTGIVGSLHRKEIDIEGVTLMPTVERLDVIDFPSAFIHNTYMVVLINSENQPESSNFFTDLFTYAKPFSIGVWLSLFAVWILFPICVSRTKGFIKKNLYASDSDIPIVTTQSPRVISWVYYMTMAILFCAYNSTFIATVAIKKGSQNFESLEDLLEDGSFKFMIPASSAYVKFIQSSTSYPYPSLWKALTSDSNSFLTGDVSLGVEWVLKHKYALMTSSANGKYTTQTICNVEMLKKKYFNIGKHFGLQKNSSLTEMVSRKLHLMKSSGVVAYLKQRHEDSEGHRCQKYHKVNEIKPFDMKQCVGPFTFLAVGVLLSFIAIGIEMAIASLDSSA